MPGKSEAEKAMKEKIAKRAAQEIKDGMYVNLGIGIPTLCSNFIDEGRDVTLECEDGLLGMGSFPHEHEVDADLINASKQTVTILPGGSFFSSSRTFAMIRGHFMDISILGGFQVSKNADLANWIIPGKKLKGMGGAMDLVSGAKDLIITMSHVSSKGELKILNECQLPLTGRGVVHLLITDKAVFKFNKPTKEIMLTEIDANTDLDWVKKNTECDFIVSPALKAF